jgi:polyisoprenoid-binding protein YceI
MIRIASFASALLLALTFAFASPAQADDWVIDGAHTNVGFKVRHNTITWVYGSFEKVDGKISYDGSDISTLKAEITIDVASVDTENAKRDEHLRSADFFDVETNPTATFKSTKVKKTDDGVELVGDFTLHGVTKEITLKAEPMAGPVNDPWGNTKIGTTATVKFDRHDFGVSWSKSLDAGGLIVGNDVYLTIELELNKVK